jgi:hypothetical protein
MLTAPMSCVGHPVQCHPSVPIFVQDAHDMTAEFPLAPATATVVIWHHCRSLSALLLAAP